MRTMNLYEKLQETEPGRHANNIGEALYDCGVKLGENNVRLLTMARTYLEKLAIDEIRKAEPWAAELVRKTQEERGGL